MQHLSSVRSSLFLPPFLLAAVCALGAACSAAGEGTSDASGSGGAGNSGSAGEGGSGFQPGGNFGGVACGLKAYGNAVPGSVLVVLDRSGSMSGDSDTPDKWAPTKAALSQMMSIAPDTLSMGLLPFPAGKFNWQKQASCFAFPSGSGCDAILKDGGCEDIDALPAVAIVPLSQSKAPIEAWLAANSPKGNTPTYSALKHAYEILGGLDVTGERFALLITDGVPTEYTPAMKVGPLKMPESGIECKHLVDIEAEALSAANGSPGVKTFVIGSPGSEAAASFLSTVAANGQTGKPGCSPAAGNCHFQIGQTNFQADLEEALAAIAGVVTNCVFSLPAGEAIDPSKVNVAVDFGDDTVETQRDESHEDGWDYTDASQKQIRLYGEVCQKYKDQKGAVVNIILGCKTDVR